MVPKQADPIGGVAFGKAAPVTVVQGPGCRAAVAGEPRRVDPAVRAVAAAGLGIEVAPIAIGIHLACEGLTGALAVAAGAVGAALHPAWGAERQVLALELPVEADDPLTPAGAERGRSVGTALVFGDA
jgi:hypothetical protein